MGDAGLGDQSLPVEGGHLGAVPCASFPSAHDVVPRCGVGLGLEAVVLHPHFVDLVFDLFRVILFRQFFFH